MKIPKKIPQQFHQFFWDTKASKLNPQRDTSFVIQRLLDWDNPEAISWVLRNFPPEIIKNAITKLRGWSGRSLAFWKSYFSLKGTSVSWNQPDSRRKPAKLWPY